MVVVTKIPYLHAELNATGISDSQARTEKSSSRVFFIVNSSCSYHILLTNNLNLSLQSTEHLAIRYTLRSPIEQVHRFYIAGSKTLLGARVQLKSVSQPTFFLFFFY